MATKKKSKTSSKKKTAAKKSSKKTAKKTNKKTAKKAAKKTAKKSSKKTTKKSRKKKSKIYMILLYVDDFFAYFYIQNLSRMHIDIIQPKEASIDLQRKQLTLQNQLKQAT